MSTNHSVSFRSLSVLLAVLMAVFSFPLSVFAMQKCFYVQLNGIEGIISQLRGIFAPLQSTAAEKQSVLRAASFFMN